MSEPAILPVRIENPLTQPDWNTQLTQYPAATFFHTREWAEVLHHTYGFAPHYFTVRGGARLSSLLPVMEVNSWLTGRRGVSLPFTDICAPLSDDKDGPSVSLDDLLHHGRQRDWRYLELRGGSLGKTPAADHVPSLTFFTHTLALNGNVDQLFKNLSGPNRSSLRKAEKSGLVVEISTTPEALRDFFSLHCQTRKQHGLPPQPFRFFSEIQRCVLDRKMGVIVSARHRSRAVASAIFFRFGPRVIYKFGASDRAFQHLRANNLVMWSAIKWCAEQGARELHFGRTSRHNDGLRRFKLGWGAQEELLSCFKFDLRKNAFVVDRDDTIGWHTRVFQSLPLFLGRWAGALLYKHVA